MSRRNDAHHTWPTRRRKQIARRHATKPKYSKPGASASLCRRFTAGLVELVSTRTTGTTNKASTTYEMERQ